MLHPKNGDISPRQVQVWRHIGGQTIVASKADRTSVWLEVSGGVLELRASYNGDSSRMLHYWHEGKTLGRNNTL